MYRVSLSPLDDGMLVGARRLLFVGLFLSSALALRVPLGFSAGDVIIGGAAGLALLSARTRHRPHLPKWICIAGYLVALGGLMAAGHSTDLAASLGATGRLVVLLTLYPWLMLNVLRTVDDLCVAALWWLRGAALCAAAAILEFVSGFNVAGAGVTNAGRYSGLTGHVSDLGGISAAGASLALLALMRRVPSRLRREAGVYGAMCCVGLILSGSVSGMTAIAAAFAVLLIRRQIVIRRAVAVGLLAAVALAYLQDRLADNGALTPWDRFLQVTGQTVGPAAGTATGQSRLELMALAWGRIQQNPFAGYGLAPGDGRLIDALGVHNVLLAGWYGGGLLTLLGVLVATVGAFYLGLRTRRHPVLEALLASSVAAIVFGMTAPSVYNRYYWLPLVMLVVGTTLARRETPFGRQPPSIQARGTYAAESF